MYIPTTQRPLPEYVAGIFEALQCNDVKEALTLQAWLTSQKLGQGLPPEIAAIAPLSDRVLDSSLVIEGVLGCLNDDDREMLKAEILVDGYLGAKVLFLVEHIQGVTAEANESDGCPERLVTGNPKLAVPSQVEQSLDAGVLIKESYPFAEFLFQLLKTKGPKGHALAYRPWWPEYAKTFYNKDIEPKGERVSIIEYWDDVHEAIVWAKILGPEMVILFSYEDKVDLIQRSIGAPLIAVDAHNYQAAQPKLEQILIEVLG